jgi:hypothetical protein
MAIARTNVARTAIAAVLLGTNGLSGCASGAMTTDEFHAQTSGLGNVENIEVNRPLRDVAATFRERASACLQEVRTTTVSGPTTRMSMRKMQYHETVVVTDRKVELAVQAFLESPLKLYREPANGAYVLIARAYPINSGRTRVELAVDSPAFSWGSLHAAVKGWAAGTSTACPDLP